MSGEEGLRESGERTPRFIIIILINALDYYYTAQTTTMTGGSGGDGWIKLMAVARYIK